MSDYLKRIDKSKNMEDLRSARSYNDIVVVLSRIKAASSSILNRLGRKLSKTEPQSVEIKLADNGDFTANTKAVAQAHDDLSNLISFSYELQYARSLSSIIASDTKMDKFRKLCDSSDVTVVKAQNMTYRYLDVIGSAIEPQPLRKYARSLERMLSNALSYHKLSSFVVPTTDDKISFVRNLVLHNVTTPNDYVLPEFIVSLHADNNFDNTFSYSVSFPNRIGDSSDKTPFSSQRLLTDAVRDALSHSFGVADVKELSEPPRRYIETMDNVLATYVSDGSLNVELESGISGSEINSLLTKLLGVAHVALNVQDPRTDIVHRVTVGPKGNKIIQLRLLDRNFYDMTAMGRLRKMLSLDSDTFNAIKAIAGD